MLTTRLATAADTAFLAHVVYESSLPPVNHSFWDDLLEGSSTTAEAFIAAMLKNRATNWSNVEDFLIVERDGQLVAAASVYEATAADYRPIQLETIDSVGQELNWSTQTTAEFCDRYVQYFGDDPKPLFFRPQTPWIIEFVAVVADARGQGVGKFLLQSLLELAKQKNQHHIGIMVINGNDRAYKAYESIGFKPYQTLHADYFMNHFDIEFSGFTKFGQILSTADS